MKKITHARPIDSARSDLMRRIRRSGTAAEEEVAIVLRALGLRYRRNVRTLPGSPDFANRSRGWVIFVHGCFWHRHKGCVRTTTPTRNRDFWLDKFRSNIKRDRRKTRLLRRMGFSVLTVWECEVHNRPGLVRRFSRLARRT
jgi:DNA mismatch endonuclease (patch repair protein)